MKSFDPLWTAVYFDCPLDTAEARRAERKFRRVLKRQGGFSRLVRGTWTIVPRRQSLVEADLLPVLPPDSEMRLVPITDKQIEVSRVYWGTVRKAS